MRHAVENLDAKDRLIVALDCDAREAMSLAHSLEGRVRWLKIGMTLFYEQGPEIVHRLRDRGFDVFLDLKLHDIPHQVEGAAQAVAALGVQMITVHASGGTAMIDSAVQGARRGAEDAGVEPPAVLAVTVLTSMGNTVLRSVGVDRTAAAQVGLLTGLAALSKASGAVCSPQEAAVVRRALGSSALVVTPGVRPAGSDKGDQTRVATPTAAIHDGASHLVVGRPITSAPVPAAAVEAILDEIREAS